MSRLWKNAIIGFVGIVALLWIVPLIGLLAVSLRPPADVVLGWWRLDSLHLTFDAWATIWSKYPLANAFWVSAQIAGISTIGCMLLTPAAAYAFHFLKFPFRRTLLIIIINSFILPQQIVIIPLFTLYRGIGLMDNIWAVIIPFVGMSFAWSVFLVKNFYEDYPKELVEAARVDGCGPLQAFWHVVLPTSLSPVFAAGILQFLWCWNGLLLPILYLRNNVPLPVMLAQLSGQYEANWDLRSVAAIVTIVVPLIIFTLFQNVFAAGAQTRSGAKE
jgi:ABC-type glycerol-3-phosphate transport system permease component